MLLGVPGIYLPSLIGGRNDQEAMRQTGEARSINRGIIDERILIERLGDASSPFHKIAKRYFHLLEQRTGTLAFHPNSRQQILRGNNAVFCVLRETPDKTQMVLALINVTAEKQEINFPCEAIGPQTSSWVDLLSEESFPVSEGNLRITLTPYRVLWLTPAS